MYYIHCNSSDTALHIAGFDLDPEVQHVNDISQKLACFTIDTDTNSSIHTGSDQGDSTETESVIDRSDIVR